MRSEWLSREQLKAYMSKPRSALLASYKLPKEKEEKNNEKAISDSIVTAENVRM
jgi:hypothetical protein